MIFQAGPNIWGLGHARCQCEMFYHFLKWAPIINFQVGPNIRGLGHAWCQCEMLPMPFYSGVLSRIGSGSWTTLRPYQQGAGPSRMAWGLNTPPPQTKKSLKRHYLNSENHCFFTFAPSSMIVLHRAPARKNSCVWPCIPQFEFW